MTQPIAPPGEASQAIPTANLTQIVRAAAAIHACERCERLRSYCRGIAETRRRAYRDEVYWGKPVAGFGDLNARVLVLGLAPGAHGANRTGRMFTGDGSGYFLYPLLHEAGFASQPEAKRRDDGLRLRDMYITAAVRCAPPGDKPTPGEFRACSTHLDAELACLPNVRVVVGLGRLAWDAILAHLQRQGAIERRAPFAFGHGVEYRLPDGLTLLGSYHPSLRNTNTGRLDQAMLLAIFARARELMRRRRRLPLNLPEMGPTCLSVPESDRVTDQQGGSTS